MTSSPIYAPVEEGLLKLEECLDSVARVDFPLLALMLGHILKRKGKRIRPAITLLAGNVFHGSHVLVPMAAGVELLHTATLVHDDTIDNSLVRRGVPTPNSLWSGKTTVLVGDYLFANAAELVSRTANVRVMQVFAKALMVICDGELHQNHNCFDPRQNRQAYYNRISSKTAALFSIAGECGAILGGASEEESTALRNYGWNLGMAFQIIDDVLDFTGEQAEIGKPVGNDLTQGTMTLPAILFVERSRDGNPVKDAFAQRSEAAFKNAIDVIVNSGTIQDSYKIASDFCDKARSDLRVLPDSPSKQSLMGLVDYVTERRK
ncbi:MAG: polyprenyl synthetase family protein [Actinobacteria bacterium]|nr:polyprenyl synthetase family protein [Actinomycetota bacterium]